MTPAGSNLDGRLAALRECAAVFEPPPSTDAAIAAAMRSAARASARRPAGRHAWIAWPLALAAAVVVVSFVVRSLGPLAGTGGEVVPAAARAEFTSLVPLSEIADSRDVVVVPARVPRMTLAQFGVPIDPARADDAVDTELLVRRDGALLAYRFVTWPQ
jgi:hypothetical protein